MFFKFRKAFDLVLGCELATNTYRSCYSRSVDSIPFPYTVPARSLSASERRHRPSGYTDYSSYKPWLRDEYDFRCVYCLAREVWDLNATGVASGFGIDHMRSQRDAPDEEASYENLCYCCNDCNSLKGAQSLPQPLIDEPLDRHFRINEDGSVSAITAEGIWLRDCLLLDLPAAVERRRLILDLRLAALSDLKAGRDSPKLRMFGYPFDLENLALRNPPSNTRPAGLEQTAWARRERSELPRFY